MYATLDDLKKQIPEDMLIQLTDDAGSGVVDSTIVDAALETADVEIDGYIGVRCALPLNPVPAIIVKQAIDLAIYNLYARRQGPPDHWQRRYDNVIRFLGMVAKGDISLGVGDPNSTGSGDEAVASSGDRIFSRETLSGY
jgi:phage gp36-like protein